MSASFLVYCSFSCYDLKIHYSFIILSLSEWHQPLMDLKYLVRLTPLFQERGFQLIRCIAVNNTSRTILCEAVIINESRSVALKIIYLSSSKQRKKFQREVQTYDSIRNNAMKPFPLSHPPSINGDDDDNNNNIDIHPDFEVFSDDDDNDNDNSSYTRTQSEGTTMMLMMENHFIIDLRGSKMSSSSSSSFKSSHKRFGVIVLPLMEFDGIDLITEYAPSVPELKEVFWQLCTQVRALHKMEFIHLDIKPENILFLKHFTEAGNRSFSAFLADFGSSRHHYDTENLSKIVGTLLYLPPELRVLKSRSSRFPLSRFSLFHSYHHNHHFPSSSSSFSSSSSVYDAMKFDVWSLGVSMFVMMTGEFPYLQEGDVCITNKSAFEMLDNPAVHLLSGMLTHNPLKRFGMEDVISHPFWSCNDNGV